MKLIGLIFLILGSFIGAGFISGKEISNYFSQFGFVSYILIIFVGLFMFYFIKMCLNLGENNSKLNVYQIISKYFGKLSVLINFIVFISCIVILGSMTACSYSIGLTMVAQQFAFIFPIIIIVIAFALLLKGISGIKNINLIFMPIVFVIIITIFVLQLCNGFNISIEIDLLKTLNAIYYSVNYICMNMLLIGVFLIKIGGMYCKKTIKKASVISSIIIVILLCLINFVIISNQEFSVYDMPLLNIALKFNSVIGICTYITMLLGLLTTYLATAIIVIDYINMFLKNYVLSIAFTLAISLIISLLGFSFIVINLYLLVGIFGAVFIISLLKNKKTD